MLIKMCNEITYPFPNSHGRTVEVWEWIANFIQHLIVMQLHIQGILGIKLIHVSEEGPARLLCMADY